MAANLNRNLGDTCMKTLHRWQHTIEMEKVVSSEATSHHKCCHSSWLSLLFLLWLQVIG